MTGRCQFIDVDGSTGPPGGIPLPAWGRGGWAGATGGFASPVAEDDPEEAGFHSFASGLSFDFVGGRTGFGARGGTGPAPGAEGPAGRPAEPEGGAGLGAVVPPAVAVIIMPSDGGMFPDGR